MCILIFYSTLFCHRSLFEWFASAHFPSRWNIKKNAFVDLISPLGRLELTLTSSWVETRYVRKDLRYFVVSVEISWKLILFTPKMLFCLLTRCPRDNFFLGLCSAHEYLPMLSNCLWLRCLRFFCWNDKYKDLLSFNRNRVITTRNGAREARREETKAIKIDLFYGRWVKTTHIKKILFRQIFDRTIRLSSFSPPCGRRF